MSKSSTSSKIPPQLSSKSAWAKGPPQSSRSESPAPTHSRRPSAAIGQAVPIKDGVSIPRNNVGSVKNGSSVTFGSIDDASAPISSSPAATPAVKPVDAVKSFGSVPNEVNGTTKPANPPTKLQKADIKKLFQTPTSTGGPSTPSESSSPAPRPVSLPPQTQTPQPSSFTSQNGARSQQPPSGAPPRSPQYSRQLPNGNGGRNGPPSGLSSPRLAPMTHTGQPAGMTPQPPPQMTAMPPPPTMWPPYYYIDPNYLQYGQPWPYGMPQPMPQQQPPQQQPHMPPHPSMPVSPRNPPPPLQGPGTPTPAHAVPATHSPHPSNIPHSSSTNISGLSSPPPTPSTSTSGGRLNQNAQAFVPTRPTSKIILKSADGIEVNIAELKSKSATTTSSPAPSAASIGSASPKRKSVIRIETPEDKAKRVAEEKEAARLKAESEEKARKAKEEQERKAQEEQERKEKEVQEQKKKEEEERIRKEQEATERERKKEEELKERLRKEEEERKRKEEEEAAASEKERLRKEEEEKKERLKKQEEQKRREEEERKRQQEEERKRQEEEERKRQEEEERVKKEEERALKEKEEAPAPTKVTEPLEEGELVEEGPSELASAKEQEKKDKAALRINTTPASPHSSEIPRRRPGPLDLSTAKGPVAPAPPSALATARIIEDIKTVQYPEGIKSPRIELNANAKDGKFRYDREFLLQFMAICKDKPDSLPPLDAIGLEPSDFPITRGGSHKGIRDRTPSTSHPVGVPFPKGGKAFPPIGNFGTMPGKPQDPSRATSLSGPGPGYAGRPSPMQRTTSQGASSTGRVRSQRGGKREQRQAGQQSQGSAFQPGLANPSLDYVPPLQATANRWDRKALIADTETPEYVDRKVKALLNKLTMEKFDSISDQIVIWANRSEKEKDGRTLIQVIRLVFEKATDEATWSEMYARLCRKMMETISSKVQDDGIKNSEGKPIAGGQLFRKYLLNRCQEDFERGWAAKEATAAAAASKGEEDAKVAEKEGTEEAELYSEEYYAAQKAKRQGLGLIKFIGELFKLQMLTERIMHECIKKLLGNVENPEEEEIESLCKLLTTVGSILDTNKARAHMDVYFSRMKELTKSLNVSSRMQFMLQDVIELRERKWVSRNAVAAPTTIAAVHELAAREGQANAYNQRTISMSRGGSKRGADRTEYQQAGPDGWTTAGPSSTPRPPPKAGDLSKFGQITKSSTPATFGPASVFSNKSKESKKELQRTSSSSNMFSMLSSNAEAAAELKSSRPPSRKTSVDFSQTGGVPPDGPPQRRRLMLQPRTKPLEGPGPTPTSQEPESSEGEEEEEESVMTDEQAKKKIEEDTKEFFAVRSLEEAEVYFSKLPSVHHPKLVDKLVSLALESKEADAHLVADFFDIASSKELCTLESLEAGFVGCMEFLDDVAIDAPKAPVLMAIMLKGPPFDDEQLARLAAKSEENGPSLLSS